jgi:hypothetical protein
MNKNSKLSQFDSFSGSEVKKENSVDTNENKNNGMINMNYRTYVDGGNTKEEAIEYLKTCEKPIKYYLEIGNHITTNTTLTNDEASELIENDDLIIKVVEYDDCVEIVKGSFGFTSVLSDEIKERGLNIL